MAWLAKFREIVPVPRPQFQKRGHQSCGVGLINQNGPFTFYEKAVMAGGRAEVSNADILRGPADADLFACIPPRGRFDDTADRPRTRPRTCTSVFRLEGTNTWSCGLIGKWNLRYRGNSAAKRNDGKYDLTTACVHSILFLSNIITKETKDIYKYKGYWKMY